MTRRRARSTNPYDFSYRGVTRRGAAATIAENCRTAEDLRGRPARRCSYASSGNFSLLQPNPISRRTSRLRSRQTTKIRSRSVFYVVSWSIQWTFPSPSCRPSNFRNVKVRTDGKHADAERKHGRAKRDEVRRVHPLHFAKRPECSPASFCVEFVSTNVPLSEENATTVAWRASVETRTDSIRRSTASLSGSGLPAAEHRRDGKT